MQECLKSIYLPKTCISIFGKKAKIEILAEIKILDKNTDELFTQIKELNL